MSTERFLTLVFALVLFLLVIWILFKLSGQG